MTPTPTPNNWLITQDEYRGKGTAQFSEPAGTVQGDVHVIFDEYGRTSVEMQVEKVDNADDLDLFTFSFARGGSVVGMANKCTSLSVSTPEGCFTATTKIGIGDVNTDSFATPESDHGTLKFDLISSEFEVDNANTPQYWVLPLTNFVAQLVQGHKEFDQHPLRIYKNPGYIQKCNNV